MHYLPFIVLILPLTTLTLANEKPTKATLLFEDDFRKGTDRWQPSDANAWKVIDTGKGKAYSQFRQSDYKPPHRSPLNFALVKDLVVGDLVLEAQVRSTVRDYDHRDVCLFFGYQDASHFYYVHLGKKTDDHANQVFIVNGAPRRKISTKTSDGTPWDDAWHTVKVVRRISDGSIEVYFDDMNTPVMTARDKTFLRGQVGVGSFDDTGDWTKVKVYGTRLEKASMCPNGRGTNLSSRGLTLMTDFPSSYTYVERPRRPELRTEGEYGENGVVYTFSEELSQKFEGRGVHPVQILDGEQDRLPGGARVKPIQHGPERLFPLPSRR